MNWLKLPLLLAVGVGLLLPRSGAAAGVTVIAHGFTMEGGYPGWLTAMADQIPHYPGFPGTSFTTYRITVSRGSTRYLFAVSRVNGDSPLTTDSGEILIEFDWSQLSQKVSSAFAYANTYDIAAATAQVFLQTNFIPELGGHALVELPLHLIGHNRGASLMAELSRQLGSSGVWVDHVTSLDPHPFNNDGNVDPVGYSDAPASNTYANVLFADDYWQNLGTNFLAGDPGGEPVAGAYVRQLTTLSGGYGNYDANVHLWYHGTIDSNTPASDTESTITAAERTAWWASAEAEGQMTGFRYSLIGGGDRLGTDQPLGAGTPAVRDGFNQRWDLGAGISSNRTALQTNAGTWPDVIRFNLTGPNVVNAGQPVPVAFYYQYAGALSNITVRIALDPDFNPFDSTGTLVYQGSVTNTGADSVSLANVSLSTAAIAPGTYAVAASINVGPHTRYLYAPGVLVVNAAPPRPVLDIARADSNSILIGVTGASNQTVVLQQSANLQSWLPVATNTLSGARWIYTNQLSSSPGFFRAETGQ